MRFGRRGTQFDRAPEASDSAIHITLLLQHRRQHVMRIGELRIQRDRLPELRGRIGAATRLPQHDTERIRRIRQCRIDRHRLPQRLLRIGELILLFERHPEVVVAERVLRIARHEIAARRHGSGEVAALHLRHAHVEARRVIVRRACEQRRPQLLRLETFTTLHEREREAVGRFVILRRDDERAPERGDRAVEIARRLTRQAKVQMNGREIGTIGCGTFEFAQRPHRVAALLERESEVVASFGMTRIQADRRLQRLERSLEILHPPARRAEMIESVEEVRLQRDGLGEQFQRFRRAALLPADEAEPIAGLRRVERVLLDGEFVERHGVRAPAFLFSGQGLFVERADGPVVGASLDLRQRGQPGLSRGGHTDGEDGGGRQHSPHPAGKQCHEANLSTSLRPGQPGRPVRIGRYEIGSSDNRGHSGGRVRHRRHAAQQHAVSRRGVQHVGRTARIAGAHAGNAQVDGWQAQPRHLPVSAEARNDRRRGGCARRREGIAVSDAVERPPLGAGGPRTPAATAPGARYSGGAGDVRAARSTCSTRSPN